MTRLSRSPAFLLKAALALMAVVGSIVLPLLLVVAIGARDTAHAAALPVLEPGPVATTADNVEPHADTGTEARTGARAGLSPAFATAPARRVVPLVASEPVDSQTRVDAHIATLDRRFGAEPVDSAWASHAEAGLRAFFDPASLAAQGLPSPQGLSASCHRYTCRVSARYDDPDAAEAAAQQLGLHLADRLPYGTVMPRLLDDGRVEVNAWYSSRRFDL